MSEYLARVSVLAYMAHQGQTDKLGEAYIEHPRAVASMVSALTDDEDVIAAAWLHDTVEDTGYTLDDIRVMASERTADLVDLLTRRFGTSPDDYYAAIRIDHDANLIKRMDIMHNLHAPRFSRLPEATRIRLRQKYLHALEELT